jgi:small redox-active disulfide protein 2
MVIQILGSGCQNCKTLFSNTKVALQRLQVQATVEYITDIEKIGNSGIMQTPGLVINQHVVSQGKVLAPIQIEALIKQFLFLK